MRASSTEPPSTGALAHRLAYGRVLVELGLLEDAEAEVVEALEEDPQDLTALSLYGKIKHIRGELSQAVACWVQISVRSPHNETAQMHLRAMLQLAQDPEKGAGEFLALGQYHLERKPAAQMELEEAFRMFLARRPTQARERCQEIARKHRDRDRDTYKLAVLAQAWIAEMSGNLEDACRTLEELGQERGFETDTDRLLALLRLYEHSQQPGHLAAAVNIANFLSERFHKISLMSRLAVLHRRLGREEQAASFERRYLESFRRRMHRVTLDEVAAVAARRYLPLGRVATLRFPEDRWCDGGGQRGRACALAIQGAHGEARPIFERVGEPLDQKYLADIDQAEGQPESAARRYVEAQAKGPPDPFLLAQILDDDVLSRTGPVVAHFGQPDHARPARALLETRLSATPLVASLWRQLAALARLEGRAAEAERCSGRAHALDLAAREREQPVGRVLAAGVYHFLGRAKGLVHEVWAGREVTAPGRGGSLPAESVMGNLAPEMKTGIRNTFMAAREYARTKFPHLTTDLLDYNYTYKVTKEDEPSGGLSAGLPTSLAFLSLFLKRPVDQRIASSGVVVADAHDVLTLRMVGEAEHKVRAAYHRNLSILILPLENRRFLESDASIPAPIRQEIVRYAADLDEAVRIVFGPNIFC